MTAKGVRKRNSNGLRAQLGSSCKAGPGEKEERRQSENTVMETEEQTFQRPQVQERKNSSQGGEEGQSKKVERPRRIDTQMEPQDLTYAR